MEALYVERRKFVAETLAFTPVCVIRWDKGCTGKSVDVHEFIARSAGGSILPDGKAKAQGQRFIPTCRWCHDKCTSEPAEARRRGWVRSRWG